MQSPSPTDREHSKLRSKVRRHGCVQLAPLLIASLHALPGQARALGNAIPRLGAGAIGPAGLVVDTLLVQAVLVGHEAFALLRAEGTDISGLRQPVPEPHTGLSLIHI